MQAFDEFKALARGEQTGTRRLMLALDALYAEELAEYRRQVGEYVAELSAAEDAAAWASQKAEEDGRRATAARHWRVMQLKSAMLKRARAAAAVKAYGEQP